MSRPTWLLYLRMVALQVEIYFLLKTDLLLTGTDCSLCEEVKDLRRNIPGENGSGQS